MLFTWKNLHEFSGNFPENFPNFPEKLLGENFPEIYKFYNLTDLSSKTRILYVYI